MEKTLVLIIFYFCVGIAIGLLIAKLKALKKKDVELELQEKIDTLKLEKEEITLENEKLKNFLEEKQNEITQNSVQNKFDEFCSRYKSDAIAKIKLKNKKLVLTGFIDETKLRHALALNTGYVRFDRVQSKRPYSISKVFFDTSYINELSDKYYWSDGWVNPKEHAIDWKTTTMYIKLADLESVEIDKNMEAYI